MRGILALLFIFGFFAPAWGETYSQWENSVPNQPPAHFTNWCPPTFSTGQINNSDYSVFEPPLGSLFGYLDFSSIAASDFPLKVRLRYVHISPTERSRTPNATRQRVPSWTSPIQFLKPDAELGNLIEQRETEIKTPAEGALLPVWSLSAPPTYEGSEAQFNPYSVLLEVARADGTPLIRNRLIEAVAGGTNASVAVAKSNTGAESYFKDLSNLSTVDELPLQSETYSYLNLLWLDDATLRDPKYDDSFWQKVFLHGVMVIGHANNVQALAQRLGIAPDQRILLGGLWAVDQPTVNFGEQLEAVRGNNRYDLQLKPGENPFPPAAKFGKNRVDQLRHFSIWFLATFTIFEMAVIVGSIFLLGGNRRVLRWLFIPLAAVAYSAAGMLVVRWAVDFRPDVEFVQEVYSVEGWPESLVRTDVTRLGFSKEGAAIDAPPFASFGPATVDQDSQPLYSISTGAGTTFDISQRYGKFSSMQFQYWTPSSVPCQFNANRQIVANRRFDGAWIWDGSVWRNLGPLQPGVPVAIDHASVVIDSKKISHDGSPGNTNGPWPNQDMLPESLRKMCAYHYMEGLKNRGVGLLVAVDSRAAPDHLDEEAGSEVHRRTVLYYQFKLPAVTP